MWFFMWWRDILDASTQHFSPSRLNMICKKLILLNLSLILHTST
jgi:hypothetical protein